MITSQMQIRSSSWSICTLPTVCNRPSKPVFSLLPFFNWLSASFKCPPAASSDTDCSGYVLLPCLWLCLNFLPKSLSKFLSNTYLLQLPFFIDWFSTWCVQDCFMKLVPIVVDVFLLHHFFCSIASVGYPYTWAWLTFTFLYTPSSKNPEIPIGSWMKGASIRPLDC